MSRRPLERTRWSSIVRMRPLDAKPRLVSAAMPVRTAVIPAAGFGTRSLPATKVVPKELLPIVDKPVIQYAVEELVRAGITNICIVISEGKQMVIDHFSVHPKLEETLSRPGKEALLEQVRQLTRLADVTSVLQQEPLGLGHAVLVARDAVGDEPFVVALPDEMLDPNRNFVGEMVTAFESGAHSVVAVHQVPHEDIGLYGSIDPDDPSAAIMKVRGVVEKAPPAEAPSDLALTGRYVLGPGVFDVLAELSPGAGGEIQLADALGVLAERGELSAMRYVGRRWDVGTKQGYLEAIVTLGAEHPQAGEVFRTFLEGFAP